MSAGREAAQPPMLASIPPELVPSLPAASFAAVLAVLAYFRLGSLLVLTITLGVSVAYLSESHPSAGAKNLQQASFRQASSFVGDSSKDDGLGRETMLPSLAGDNADPPDGHYHPPAFVNHALARLWPMINTELFVPVLDLLEDTLQGECPPMVHSVRVESLELGKAPCEIRWLRPLTDAEWAEGLHADGAGKGTGKLADRDLAEGEAEGGDYANFEISFELDTSTCTALDKAGLLVVFGVGLRGLGGVEAPVFIDLQRVTGVLRLRLLLDPSPPFVRTGTFTFPTLPEIHISAAPFKRHGKGSLNAMKIPGLTPYVLSCIQRVAKSFVTPEAWSMDLDTLLSGEEKAIRSKHVGVLRIRLHRATGLRASDSNGKSDPYIALSWWKQLDKPLFSTRTLLKTVNPVWEETAFILVPADAIELGEKLVCQVYDSDRVTSDDSLGSVEVDLADVVERGHHLKGDKSVDPQQLDEREDDLLPPRGSKRGTVGHGTLSWGIRFYPLWQLTTSPSQQDAVDSHHAADGEGVIELATSEKANIERRGHSSLKPLFHPPPALRANPDESWLGLLGKYMQEWLPDKFEWESERLQRREENVRWLAGKRGVELAELQQKPSLDRRTGILQWNIIQCQDLQIRPTTAGFDRSARSKAGGIPALAEMTDLAEGEAPVPVSAYAEVILNDRLVFRSRSKARQTTPYFNATSERFVRDWTAERLTIVIKDERDRERDVILGVVDFPTLAEIFTDSSSTTRWHPLRGGLGWGLVRLSFLWKAIDISLPRGISGYDVVAVQVRQVRALELAPSISANTLRATSVVFETEADSATVSGACEDSSTSLDLPDDGHSIRSGRSSSISKTFAWDVPEPVSLAVLYRLSTFFVIKFSTRSGGLKKRTNVWAIGMLKLGDIPDGETLDVGVPMFSTADVNEAAMLAVTDREPEAMRRQIGTAFLSLRISAGLGKAHRRVVKSDPRFAAVDEAKQVVAEVMREGESAKATATTGVRHGRTGSLSSHFSVDSVPRDRSSIHRSPGKSTSGAIAGSPPMNSVHSDDGRRWNEDDDGSSSSGDEDFVLEDNDEYYRNRERDPKLYHEGISSHKAIRSGRWAKDKIASKLSGISLKHKRQEGALRRVEKEGISQL